MHTIWLAQAATTAREAAARGLLATLVRDGCALTTRVAQDDARAKVMA